MIHQNLSVRLDFKVIKFIANKENFRLYYAHYFGKQPLSM
jgi:hypothetical protein